MFGHRQVINDGPVCPSAERFLINPKKPKRKKLDPRRGMLSLLIGHMKKYGPKTVGHHFQPGVSPPTANGGESRVWE